MAANLLFAYVDHIERPPRCASAFSGLLVDKFLPDVHCEELGAKSAGFHPPEIGVSFDLRARIVAAHPQVESVFQERRCDVVVSIDDYRLTMEPFSSSSKRPVVLRS